MTEKTLRRYLTESERPHTSLDKWSPDDACLRNTAHPKGGGKPTRVHLGCATKTIRI